MSSAGSGWGPPSDSTRTTWISGANSTSRTTSTSGTGKFTPSLDFEWQIAKRHRLAARYQGWARNSNAQALTGIEWGDEIIPIDSDIALSFDTTQLFFDYTYYPWVKERWALGFGLGLRFVDLTTTLSWRLESGVVEEGSQDADVTAPLPYLYFEYRRLLTEHWRMILGGGWLDLTIGDVSGGQWIGRAGFEYLLGNRWAVGGAFNMATINVDADNISGDLEMVNLRATLDVNIWDFSIFGRVPKGSPLPVVDALISATASVHGCIVVTRNVADFERTGIEVEDPWC